MPLSGLDADVIEANLTSIHEIERMSDVSALTRYLAH
jgi:hypothetical protein